MVITAQQNIQHKIKLCEFLDQELIPCRYSSCLSCSSCSSSDLCFVFVLLIFMLLRVRFFLLGATVFKKN